MVEYLFLNYRPAFKRETEMKMNKFVKAVPVIIMVTSTIGAVVILGCVAYVAFHS